MRALHFTTDRDESAQIPISDRAATALVEMGRAAEVPEGEGDIAFRPAEVPYGLRVILTGIIEAVAEQEKLAVVAEATVLAAESEEILDRTTDEQIATGQAVIAEREAGWPGSRYRSGGYAANKAIGGAGSYGIHVRERPGLQGGDVWWESRIVVKGDQDSDAEMLRDIILRLLQGAEVEAIHGRDLLLAPKACDAYERHANESDELVSKLERENAALRERLEPKLEAPNPAGVFQFAEGEGPAIMMRDGDGLMREALWINDAAPAGLKTRVLRLLQADEVEGGNLAGAPGACRMAWNSLRERDKRISDLDVLNGNLTSAMELVSNAAGPRPGDVDLATHVENLRLSVDFAVDGGYTKAFYRMAEMIGVQGPHLRAPRYVLEGEVLPKLRDLIRFKQSNVGKPGIEEADPSPRADRGQIVSELAEALGIPDTGTARAIDFFRRELLPAVLTLKTYGDVVAAFDREERKVLRDKLAADVMKILVVENARPGGGSFKLGAAIAREAYAVADDMLKARG